ncbi:GTP cyclohydrolase FolE2 [Kribbella sp. NPDC051718]|uniref:GTP cyclohydrolase FolE2 n=1 Tax=Kribbella sp. NPDC051718 TaxID=3155168 RepID=UPI003437562F
MLPDIQDQYEPRGIPLHRVGIAGVRYPTRFCDGELKQSGIATFDLAVTLEEHRRGTHMSRMVEAIHETMQELDPRSLPVALKSAAGRLDAAEIEVRIALPVATTVTSPASGRESWQASDVEIVATWNSQMSRVATTVISEVTSLCPCSKAISDFGAHNQRSSVRVAIIGRDDTAYPLDVMSIIGLIREVGSCPIYPLIKRPDERFVTMQAYEHPAFVEDMARDVSTRLREQQLEHSVQVRNFESIHSHDAIAAVQWSPDSAM